jgi:hypothetical protein
MTVAYLDVVREKTVDLVDDVLLEPLEDGQQQSCEYELLADF